MKILIIIPAYNEYESIMGVIQDIEQYYPSADKLVINDSSTDKTKDILLQNNINFQIGRAHV